MSSPDLRWQLESVEQKIQRAHHHLQDLERRVEGRSQLYSISRHMEADGRTEVYVFHQLGQPPPVISAVTGDFIHNAWSALNHMALALHIAHSGIPTVAEEEKIAYPLSLEASHFKSVEKKWIWGIHPEARAIIEANQPYHAGNAAFRWLYNLARIDRHRKLNLLLMQINSIGWWGDPDGTWTELGSYKPLVDGAVVGRFRWNAEPDPNMKFHFACDIGLSDGARVERVGLLGNWILDRVTILRKELTPYLLP